MNNLPATNEHSAAIESALIQGNLSGLSTDQRLSYYKSVCESVGLNPLTQPFQYIVLNGKLTLYARKDATDQLRTLKQVSIVSLEDKVLEGVYIVTAKAKDGSGREDIAKGAVNINGLKGDALANAIMKAETKAKRRVTLSICGLGMLDETEIETIPGAMPEQQQPAAQPKPVQPAKQPEQGKFVYSCALLQAAKLTKVVKKTLFQRILNAGGNEVDGLIYSPIEIQEIGFALHKPGQENQDQQEAA